MLERGKPEYPEKNLSVQSNKLNPTKLNPHMTPSLGIEPGPGPHGKASALITEPYHAYYAWFHKLCEKIKAEVNGSTLFIVRAQGYLLQAQGLLDTLRF